MKIPLSWLKEYVDITVPVEDLAERLVLADVEYGAAEPHTVVTGAPNLFEYKAKVAYAKTGATLKMTVYQSYEPMGLMRGNQAS